MASVGDTPQCDPPIIIINLDEVRWEDVHVDEEGNATGVFDSEFKDFSSKQLRTICSRLNLKGVKNVKKQDMIDRLVKAYNNWKNYKMLKNRNNAAPRKQAQCSFRLMNILFSDAFADQFATIRDTATRQVLDTGTAASDNHFWYGIQQVFITPHEDYDQLLFQDDDHFSDCDIDPCIIVEHDWKKLRMIGLYHTSQPLVVDYYCKKAFAELTSSAECLCNNTFGGVVLFSATGNGSSLRKTRS